MKAKKYIKICGMKFRVKIVPSGSEKLTVNGDECYAVIEHVRNRIYINGDITKQRARKSLMHEVIHAIDAELQLGLSHKTIYRLASGMVSSGVKVECIR